MTIKLHNLKPKIKRKKRKIVGRGGARGTYSCKGVKGQKSRSGYSSRASFEGGRTSFLDQIPKLRGPVKSMKTPFEVVNLDLIELKYNEGDKVNSNSLFEAGLVKSKVSKVKVLGVGDLKKKLEFCVDSYSSSAKEKIEKSGGSIVDNKKAKKIIKEKKDSK